MTDARAPDSQRIALAASLADRARATILDYFRGALDEEDKPDATPVTLADRAAEKAMRADIAEAYSHDGIIGEEYGTERPDAEWVWVLDPIDGTKQFITGKPSFGSLIALLHGGRPVLGVIEMPVLSERWVGITSQGTERRDAQGRSRVTARACPSLDRATLCTTAAENFESAKGRAGFAKLRDTARVTVYGGDCHNYGLLANGFCDLVVDGGMSTYDYAALIPIIEGAGGVITDFAGNALTQGEADVLAAGDPDIHAAALRLFQK